MVVYGPNISLGKDCVIVAANGYRTNISSIKMGEIEGRITIGNNVLVMNAVRISSASSITIGDGCMLANHCYLTDSDWHDIHDRTRPGGARPSCWSGGWIGDSAIVCRACTSGRTPSSVPAPWSQRRAAQHHRGREPGARGQA